MSVLRRGVVGAGALLAGLALTTATAVAAPSDQDLAWMAAAHQSNLAEIAAGTAAQQKATTDDVRDLGAMFVEMHTALDADLTAAATELGVELPAAPTPEQQAELDAVAANDGAAFDAAWIAQQLGAHEKSKAAGAQEIAAGEDPTAIGLAEAAAPVVQQHLDALSAAADEYGVPGTVPSGTGGQAASSSTWTAVGLLAGGAVLIAATLMWLRRRSMAPVRLG